MRLSALVVRNFECIGGDGIQILIDQIVVLIGPNNVGKSAILDAYEVFAAGGADLPISKFHDEDASQAVEIEGIFVDITDSDQAKIGQKWLHVDQRFGECIKVQWRWATPGAKGTKSSWDDAAKVWQPGGMGGFDSLIQSCIPAPIRVSPRDDPAVTESKITEILTEVVKAKLKEDSSKTADLLAQLEQLTHSFGQSVKPDLDKACALIESKLGVIFPGHNVEFVPAIGKFEPEKAIATGSHVRLRRGASTPIPLAQQGTGLQRAFLWSALSALAELGRLKHGKAAVASERPKMLLVDEPECFLHPPSVRAAREALYGIASTDGWQVMATTHSSVFIDVAKPHTTIIRVGRSGTKSPQVFSTDQAGFSGDERGRLRMVRACHPTVNEFFFAEHVFLVEGETEHAVLTSLLDAATEDWAASRFVVNCMGKANIPLFARILNQFGVKYTVLHDADAPRVKRNNEWQTNGMWTMNKIIVDTVNERPAALPPCAVVVHVPDFEGYYFGTSLTKDKPYQALLQINRDDFETAHDLERARLLRAMLAGTPHPEEYKDSLDLQARVSEWVKGANLQDPDAWTIA